MSGQRRGSGSIASCIIRPITRICISIPSSTRAMPNCQRLRIRMKNLNNHLHVADHGCRDKPDALPGRDLSRRTSASASPFVMTASTAQLARPDPDVRLTLDDMPELTRRGRGHHLRQPQPRTLSRLSRLHAGAAPPAASSGPMRGSSSLAATRSAMAPRPPSGQTWKQVFIDEVRADIPDADWARVHFAGAHRL